MAVRIHVLAARITGNVTSFLSAMGTAALATKRLAAAWRRASAGISASARRIALVSGLIALKAIKVFADFEDTMINVGSITKTLRTKEFPLLTKAARRMGETTQFTAGQAAEAMEKLALAGLKTKDIITALGPTLELAAAGGISIAKAALISQRNLKAFGKDVSLLTKVNDTLVASFTSSLTNLEELAEALRPVAPIANLVNVSMEETAALLATLADTSFAGSLGGVALRRAFINLAAPTKKMSAALKHFGVVAGDTTFEKLEKVQRAMDGTADAQEKLAIATTVFGVRAAGGMVAILNKGMATVRLYADEIDRAGGIAKQMAEDKLQSLKNQFKLFKSVVAETAIAIGEELKPSLEKTLNQMKLFLRENKHEIVAAMSAALVGLANTLSVVSAKLRENKAEVKQVLNAMSGFTKAVMNFVAERPRLASMLALLGTAHLLGVTTAIAGLALAVGTTLVTAVRSLQVAFVAMGASATVAWAEATLGISLLIAAIAAVIVNWDKVTAAVKNNTHFLEPLYTLWDDFKELWDEIVSDIWPLIKAAFKELQPVLQELGNELLYLGGDVINILREAFLELLPVFKEIFVETLPLVIQYIRTIGIPWLKVFIKIFKAELKAAVLMAVKIFKMLAWVWNNILVPAIKVLMVPLGRLVEQINLIVDGIVGLLRWMGILESAELQASRRRADRVKNEIRQRRALNKQKEEELKKDIEDQKKRNEIQKKKDAEQKEKRQKAADEGIGSVNRRMQQFKENEARKKAAANRDFTPVESQKDAEAREAAAASKLKNETGAGEDIVEFIDELLAAQTSLKLTAETTNIFSTAAKNLHRNFLNGRISIDTFNEGMEQLKGMQDVAEKVGEFKNKLQEVFDKTSLSATAMEEFKQQADSLQQKFNSGKMGAAEFGAGIDRLNSVMRAAATAADLEAKAELQKMKVRFLEGRDTAADRAKFEEMKQAAQMKQFNQGVNTAFNNLLNFGDAAGKATEGFTGLSQGMDKFGSRMRNIGGRGVQQVANASKMLAKAWGNKNFQIANMKNQIEMQRQVLSFVKTARRRLEVSRTIQNMQVQLANMMATPPPMFTGARAGMHGFVDPGLSGRQNREEFASSKDSRTVVEFTGPIGPQMASEMVDLIETEQQRRGVRI